ncbi:MAG: tyrosine-type recombinase/integrase [Candidatus Woesearchaeota archaeon]|jgi:integrase/recombinase XerD|nr:tyrosine-type recombinase/integrase [Candidatus Woesearchaeota archaeon]MDP7610664.1 tyrosine-type recombinase/integrase [Candidatus Woesearchaeota archaeon]|tara:strand:+ start:197 stop:1072 length:876 start_codon:yes stop_codon:yes gene_type:complete
MYFRYFKRKKGPTIKQVARKRFENFVSELRLRCFSEKTIDTYTYYNNKFLDFIKKEQRSITSNDIKSYLNSLINKDIQPRTVRMALNSIKAYYEGYLGKKLFKNIKSPKVSKDLPQVLSKNEIKAMIDNTNFLKHRLLIELLYSSGIRVGECVKVEIDNIYFDDKIVFIKNGKGKKDRFTITSKIFIGDLNTYLNQRKEQKKYLFDDGYTNHISVRTAEEIVKLAAKRVDIRRRVYPHLLRASFATHLIEHGTPIEKIQKLLGHSNIDTTMEYIGTRTDDLKMIKSPLDNL